MGLCKNTAVGAALDEVIVGLEDHTNKFIFVKVSRGCVRGTQTPYKWI